MTNIDLRIAKIFCNKTTESGADEVYFLTFGRRSDGKAFTQRFPGENLHFDMNDGDQPTDNPSGDSHIITEKSLFFGDLPPGETWDIAAFFMEEDGGTSRDFQAAAAKALEAIPNPFTVAAGLVIDALTELGFFFTDSDDWLGTIGARITNTAGNVTVQWDPKARIASANTDPDAPSDALKRQFQLNGDGSNYDVRMSVVVTNASNAVNGPAVPTSEPRRLTQGMSGVDVKRWEVFLASQGFFPGFPNGDFGPRTHDETVAFQQKNGLFGDGIVGPKTLSKANELGFAQLRVTNIDVPLSPPRELRENTRGNDVKQWEVFLAARGFFPGRPDGNFGSRTKAETISFQNAEGLVQDGIVGNQTRKAAINLGLTQIQII